jgi:hypothetical protein
MEHVLSKLGCEQALAKSDQFNIDDVHDEGTFLFNYPKVQRCHGGKYTPANT